MSQQFVQKWLGGSAMSKSTNRDNHRIKRRCRVCRTTFEVTSKKSKFCKKCSTSQNIKKQSDLILFEGGLL